MELFPSEAQQKVVSLGVFGGALATAIRRLKYEERPDLAEPLGGLLGQACRSARLEVDTIVPVPLHPLRLATRGYNQSALLARAVASRLEGSRVRTRALVRTVDTPGQARLPQKERLYNVDGAFGVPHPAMLAEKCVLLVDDVLTTGATLRTCAQELERAGARSVSMAVLARALRTTDDGPIATDDRPAVFAATPCARTGQQR